MPCGKLQRLRNSQWFRTVRTMDANIRAQDPALFFATHTPISVRAVRLAAGLQAPVQDRYSECDILNLIFDDAAAIGNRVFLFSGATGMGKTELCQWLGFMLERLCPDSERSRCSHGGHCAYWTSQQRRDVIRVMKDWDFVEVVQQLVNYANRYAEPGQQIGLDCDFGAIRNDLQANPIQYAYQLGALVFRDLSDSGMCDAVLADRAGEEYRMRQAGFCNFLVPIIANLVKNRDNADIEVRLEQVREVHALQFLDLKHRRDAANTAAYITERLLHHLREVKRLPSPKEVLRQIVALLGRRHVRPILIIEDIAKLSIDRLQIIDYLQDLGQGSWDVIMAGTDEYMNQLDIDTLQDRFSRFTFGHDGSQSEFCNRDQAPEFFAPYLEYARRDEECDRCPQAQLCTDSQRRSLYPFTPDFVRNVWDSEYSRGGKPRQLVQCLFTLLDQAAQGEEGRTEAVARAAHELGWNSKVLVSPEIRESNPELYATAKWYGRYQLHQGVTVLDLCIADFFSVPTIGAVKACDVLQIPFSSTATPAANKAGSSGQERAAPPVVDETLLRLKDGIAGWQRGDTAQDNIGDYIAQGALHVMNYVTGKGRPTYNSPVQWVLRDHHVKCDGESAENGEIVLPRTWSASFFSRVLEIGYYGANANEARRNQLVQQHLMQDPAWALQIGELAGDWSRRVTVCFASLAKERLRALSLAVFAVGVQLSRPGLRITLEVLASAYAKPVHITEDWYRDLISAPRLHELRFFVGHWDSFRALFGHFFMHGDLPDRQAIADLKTHPDTLEWAYSFLVNYPRNSHADVSAEWTVGGNKLKDMMEAAWTLGHRVLDGEGSIHRQNFHQVQELQAYVTTLQMACQELASDAVGAEAQTLRRLRGEVQQSHTTYGPKLLELMATFGPSGDKLRALSERCRTLLDSLLPDYPINYSNPMVLAAGHHALEQDTLVQTVQALLQLLQSWTSIERGTVASADQLEELSTLLGEWRDEQ